MPTISPARSAFAASTNAASLSAGSSLADATGIACIVRNTQLSSGTRKIRWSMMKRMGRRTHAAMTIAST